MSKIETRVRYDENNRPVAVEIPYAAWLEIQPLLELALGMQDLAPFAGAIAMKEDPLDYQRTQRAEWDQ